MAYLWGMQTAAAAENKVFQALADPSRRAIFESLTRGEAAVKDLGVPSDRVDVIMKAAKKLAEQVGD